MITLIAAVDQNMGIGTGNRLPWDLPEDLAYFKRVTSGSPVIMGRKTFDSIGRILPNRRNVVITRQKNLQYDQVEVVHSLPEALSLTEKQNPYIIGGETVFAEAIGLADRLLVTHVENSFECDTFFPAISKQDWVQYGREDHVSEASGLKYSIVTYLAKRRAV